VQVARISRPKDSRAPSMHEKALPTGGDSRAFILSVRDQTSPRRPPRTEGSGSASRIPIQTPSVGGQFDLPTGAQQPGNQLAADVTVRHLPWPPVQGLEGDPALIGFRSGRSASGVLSVDDGRDLVGGFGQVGVTVDAPGQGGGGWRSSACARAPAGAAQRHPVAPATLLRREESLIGGAQTSPLPEPRGWRRGLAVSGVPVGRGLGTYGPCCALALGGWLVVGVGTGSAISTSVTPEECPG
jgi:hypothetical protein